MQTRRLPLSVLAQSMALGCVLVLAIFVPIRAQAAPADAPSVIDPRYFVGANVAWFSWGCDFGCGANGGVSSPAVRSAVADGFGRLKAAGVHTARWWTFEGDAHQIMRDASGAPTGLNPSVYADFDAALDLANQYDLVYDFVLFSSPTAIPRAWITDPTQRQRLADALAPLFERYKNNPRILAWEVVNEPEYEIWNNNIPLAPVQATVKLLAATVHAHTTTAVTVGEATVDGIPMWTNLGLDFHSPHWYDQMSTGRACARCSDVASIRASPGIDGLPIVLGEFYGGPDVDTLQRLKDFRAKGYAGAWAWSLFTEKTSDGKRIDLTALTSFSSDADTTPQPPAVTAPAVTAPAPMVQLLTNWVSPNYATAGQPITFNQDILSSLDASVLVDFEVYDDAGQKVSQTALDNQTLLANNLSSFSTTITLPASTRPGRYTLKTGAFTAGWGTMYAWSDNAGTFVVDSPPPTPTPAVEPAPDDQSPD